MTSATPAAAIEARLLANWTTTQIEWPNAGFTPPRDDAGAYLPFVSLEYPGAVSDQITIGSPGSNLFRERGVFLLHVLVPAGTGRQLAAGYADELASIFRGQTFGGVRCWAPYAPASGGSSDGNYFVVSFGVPYEFDLLA